MMAQLQSENIMWQHYLSDGNVSDNIVNGNVMGWYVYYPPNVMYNSFCDPLFGKF